MVMKDVGGVVGAVGCLILDVLHVSYRQAFGKPILIVILMILILILILIDEQIG